MSTITTYYWTYYLRKTIEMHSENENFKNFKWVFKRIHFLIANGDTEE